MATILRAFVAMGVVTAGLASMSCGSANTAGGPPQGSSSSGGSSGGGLSGTSSGSGSATSSGSASGSGSGAGEDAGPGSTSGSSASSSGGTGEGGGNSGSSTSSSSGSGQGDGSAAACVKGQVKPNEVVMLGDSYLDIGHVGPTIQMVANATYRTYYLAGSALNYGSGALNIPYQFDSEAVTANPDIKVVITDGGGNDILIDNSQCLTTPVMGDTSCHTAIMGSIAKATQLFQDMAGKGVKEVVFFFYPHVSPTVGADANDWLDYAYPQVAQLCCGANAPAQGSPDLTCEGNAPGLECVFVDTRPEFVGHNMSGSSSYWFQDGIHPTQPGADAIAAKVWAQMQKYCIAQ
jgi:lysophospholipase L1-like esterase